MNKIMEDIKKEGMAAEEAARIAKEEANMSEAERAKRKAERAAKRAAKKEAADKAAKEAAAAKKN